MLHIQPMLSQHSQTKPNNLESTGYILKVDNISKSFLSNKKETSLLKDISFGLSKGKIVSIVGQSGCGKTTLLNIIAGLVKPNNGEISINGTISYVPQKDLLLSWRTVLENILLPVEIKKQYNEETVILARDFLQKNNLGDFSEYYPKDISGGMKQKISLIRAFIQNSDIILCDEPFSAIDFDARLKLVREFRSYILSSQKSALFITHNIEEAISISDEIIVLGSKPTQVLYKSKIDISEDNREPVSIRKIEEFDNLFEKIWKVMSS